jgi:hypothetical protein
MPMTVTTSCVKTFGLHQTFTPKLRWFVKSYRGVKKNPSIFSDPDAPSQLGVGKNMVASMLHWALTFQLVQPKSMGRELRRSAAGQYEPAPLGSFLLDQDRGVDPFIEMAESLWLLHWVALRPPSRLPTWWLAFNALELSKFSGSDLEMFCRKSLADSEWRYERQKVIKRDVDCLLRMYADRVSHQRSEITRDVTDELFRDLRLVHLSPTTDNYQFVWGEKPSLTAPLICLFAFDVIAEHQSGQRTWSPSKVLNGPNGLAGRLKIGIDDLVDAWVELSTEVSIDIAYPTGVPQLTINEEPERLRRRTLELVYGRAGQQIVELDPLANKNQAQFDIQGRPHTHSSNENYERQSFSKRLTPKSNPRVRRGSKK